MSEGSIQWAPVPDRQGRERDCANLAALPRTLDFAGVLLYRSFQNKENFADAFKNDSDRKQQHTEQRVQGFSATVQKCCRLACEFLLCLGHMLHSESSALGHLSVTSFHALALAVAAVRMDHTRKNHIRIDAQWELAE